MRGAILPVSEAKLTIAGIATCEGSDEVVDLFLASLRCATEIQRSRRSRGDERPSLKARDVRSRLNGAQLATPVNLDLLGHVLQVDGSWWSRAATGDGDWEFELSRGIRRYREVTTLADYWTVRSAERGGPAIVGAPAEEDGPVVTSEAGTAGPLFLSHASADAELGDLFSRTLRLAGFPGERLFYSSARSTGVRAGADVSTTLRSELLSAGLVLELITDTFLQRPMCLMELGGAWALGRPTFPVVVPPLTRDQVKAAIGDVHTTSLGSGTEITRLFDELGDRLEVDLGVRLRNASWSEATRRFVDELPSVLAGLGADGLGSGTAAPGQGASAQGPRRQTVPPPDARVMATSARREITILQARLSADGRAVNGRARNEDGVERSAVLSVVFYDDADDIVASVQGSIAQVAAGQSKAFSIPIFEDVTGHTRYEVQVDLVA